MAQRALLVGVNKYKNVSGLRGCVNDVVDMHLTLRTVFGFESKDIRVVTDERATKEAILTRLDWLLKGAKANDFLVFHFSGHGSQIRDRNGDELTDHLDELICPHDMDWENSFIADDDLDLRFSSLPAGVLLEVFLDCCHSGTGLRDLCPPEGLAGPDQVLNRYLAPPIDVQLRAAGEEDELSKKRFLLRGDTGTGGGRVLWAGCASNQTSADALIGSDFRGAFTYYLTYHLRRDAAAKRSELIKRVRLSLKQGGYAQTPELETDAARRGMRIP